MTANRQLDEAIAKARRNVADGVGELLVVIPDGMDLPGSQDDDDVNAISSRDLVEYANEDRRVKRASYRHAVEWIALNDEPTERDPGEVAEATTTSLIADIFGVTPARVAADIIRYRTKREV